MRTGTLPRVCSPRRATRVDVPLMPMTYSSICSTRTAGSGSQRDAKDAGATSLIVADLPVDVHPELRRVQLVAPTSTDERLRARRRVHGRLAVPRDRDRHDRRRARSWRPRSRRSPRARARPTTCRCTPASGSRRRSTPAAAAELVDGVVVGSRAVEAAEAGEARAALVRRLRSAPRDSTARSLFAMHGRRPCRLRPGRAGGLRPRRDDRQARANWRARPPPAARELVLFPETFVPVYPLEPLGAAPRARHRRSCTVVAARSSSRSRSRGRRRTRSARPRARRGVWLAVGVNELERGIALQLAPRLRAGRLARAAPPQARADEPRAPRLGPGRRPRPRDRRHRASPASAG